jgi:uncharacterized protein YdeI (YjbR/CyaY-like superfamily)
MAKTKAVARGASPTRRTAAQELATVHFASMRAWERWLEANHARSRGVWLKIAKRDGGATSVSYAEALEVALLFGWIDGQKDKLDDAFWLQKFTPRGAKSRWSETNRASAMRLVREGRMRPSGLAAIDSAKADGRWDAAYAPQSRASVPPDLARALDAHPAARTFFGTLDAQNRYAILYRVQDAKKPETRARRIATFVEMLANGETLHPKPTRRAKA